jgi:hypothetical protein
MDKGKIARSRGRDVSGEPARVYEVDSLVEARVIRSRRRRAGRIIVRRNKELLE